MGMMVTCTLFGLLIFIALAELIVLEFMWIKRLRQQLRNESRPAPAIGSRTA